MNTTRPRRHLMTLLGLDPAERRSSTRIRFTVTTSAALATAVQIIAWLLTGVFRTRLDAPWWLWTPGGALLLDAALLSLDHVRDQWPPAGSPHSLRSGNLRTDDVPRESL
ncbi:hypothetical protein ACIQB4_06855 [Streptomyces griseoluteus]|uniref:hypothetical protein n=1 Tax=Streptomyces griseoluteus TaxID=29306 RepID=UPI003807BE4A